jgi:Ni/Co efflux regulator RcnB
MKKLMVCLLAVTFAMSLTAVAQQDTMSQDHSMAQTQSDSAAKAPLMTLKGTVKTEGDKVMFVNDKDGKSWDVMNPEELKAHDGHHVQLSAHVYADKNAIHVMSVKMLKAGSMGNDSMSK